MNTRASVRRSTWLGILFAAACGAPDEKIAAPNTGEVGLAFEEAANDAGVPTALLMAISYTETRWTHVIPEAEGEGSHALPRWGIMGLTDDKVIEAARILDSAEEPLRNDLASNIRAGAAVLRDYAEAMAEEDAPVDQYGLADWHDAVAVWSGLDDPELALSYVEDVFNVIKEGAGRQLESGEALEIIPQDVERDAEDDQLEQDGFTQSEDGLTGQGGAIWSPAASSNYTNGRGQRVNLVVIHTCQGGYSGCVATFKNPSRGASAHYVLRSSDGQMTQMVDEADTAWHAGNWNYNQRSVGIEHEGFVDNTAWYTEAMYRSSARLTCGITRRHNIPIDRDHIIGHAEVPDPYEPGKFGGAGNHTDPGRNWNWGHFIALVRDECGQSSGGGNNGGGSTTPPPSSGNATLQGIVYRAPDTNARIGGAHIRLSNGATATTASNGYWSLRVPAGRYTVTASKDGFANGSVARDVPAGQSIWASVGLRRAEPAPQPRKGVIAGFVYEQGNASRRLSGAEVRAGGVTVRTDSQGRYRIEVVAGSVTVAASKSGYNEASATRTVVGGQTTEANLGLAPARPPANAKVVGVVYIAPDTGRRISGARVRLPDGTTTTTRSDGYFEFRVPAGTYRVTASAAGYTTATSVRTVSAGGTIWASVGLRRAASPGTIVGAVYQWPTLSRRIAGATVTLANGTTVTTDRTGIYRVQLPAGGTWVTAFKDGYMPRSLGRQVIAGRTVWANIGLKRQAATGGNWGGPQLVSPVNFAAAPSNPTFTWRALSGSESYVVFFGRMDSMDAPVYEFSTTGTSGRFNVRLAAGPYMWGVYSVKGGKGGFPSYQFFKVQ
jgi:hypothetical protein